ncbi:probable DNA double-strand break repair Rad50 ATPase [Ptychodera flava]|uniref:probable DNA double-strand break repair Rad50 ATPase n=1 Tax=Ptychodera flava TaxID=63121 RepID=UPI00396A742F
MGNATSNVRERRCPQKGRRNENIHDGTDDWDVDMFHKALNDVAFRFEEILTENTRLKKKATRCLFRKKRPQSKKQSVYGRSEMDELRMMFREMTTRVQEIVQENNELNEQLEQSENHHIDQLNSLSEERHKLQEEIVSLEKESEEHLKNIHQLKALKEEMSRELSDVKSELKFTEESADTIEKEKFEFELKVEILEEKRKELEEKLAKYKKVDMEAFSLRKNKRHLERALVNAEKENKELKCKLTELEKEFSMVRDVRPQGQK